MGGGGKEFVARRLSSYAYEERIARTGANTFL